MSNVPAARPRGTGSIIQRGNRWKAQFPIADVVVDGKRRRKFSSETFKTKPEAEAWLREQLTDRDKGQFVVPTDMTVAQLLAAWMSVKTKLAANTRKEYESIIRNRILPTLGDIKAQSLTVVHLEALYAKLSSPGANLRTKKATALSQTSIKRVHEVLTGALGWAVKRGILVKNAASEVEDPPKANKPRPKAWTAEQLDAFLKVAQEPFWTFLAFTGCRLSEGLGLLWSEVDLANSRVTILRRSIRLKGQPEMMEVEGTKTAAGTRVLDLDAETVQTLRLWKLKQGNGGVGLVFPFHSDAMDREFNRHVKAAGVPDYGIHCLRHTMATLMLMQGVPAKVVSERLGHSDVAFTLKQYQTVLPGMQKDAVAAFRTLLAGVAS